ncbi:hypothetical protein [Niastella sp. OAS944]|jgi:hypothetical protein|uniref:hypothetical protein n=1 Tax=Niastella sp. OAS944 TaxID=2664089 RepID=UPI003493EE7D|nr:hypothetical protein [Chitinophagaceae bacterium OAS944]
MKRFLFFALLICIVNGLRAQTEYILKADSVKVKAGAQPAELIIENSTRNVNGFLYNKGAGRTEFRRVIKLNDSTLIFGGDTIVIKGAALPAGARRITTVTTSSYTIAPDVDVVFVSYAGRAIITLPTGITGREITIKNLNTTNDLNIVGLDASELNYISARRAITVMYTGSEWVGISRY